METVLKLYIDKSDTFVDVDNVYWNTADIIFTSNETQTLWNDKNFRKNILQKCYLWETMETNLGHNSREYFKRRKQERNHHASMGYF